MLGEWLNKRNHVTLTLCGASMCPVRQTRRSSSNSRILSPAVYAQSAFYRSLDLRDRILNLPLMIATILAMLWRQIPSVCELTRTLNREGALWMRPAKVSQPALSKRLLTFPAELFQQVFYSLLPKLRARWQARQRPLPESVRCALGHFERLYAVDGSALEAL